MGLENIVGITIPPGDRILTYGNPQKLSVIGIIRNSFNNYSSDIVPIQAVRFSSSNPNVITVSSDGIIEAVNGATGINITISATTYGLTASIKCTVPISAGFSMGVLGLTYSGSI